ncbi:M48 family metallopeptidase [Tumebacillus flagellatus]|uniref:Peptidase M48 domain-containing protein n=1 Tax=Tumebacillus flagellatus TaxID=1157490 RepID=A0A074LGH4_9BACL|nr:M48 family metallopeptidase [Tumebacillus flagellatus]KEO81336.1 hypothetical protein EL26_21095 [Tumebacillus flagellatus]
MQFTNYSLNAAEYRHRYEFAVRITYFVVGLACFALLLWVNWIVALSLLVGLLGVFFTIYLTLRGGLANYVKVGPNQFPEIYALTVEAAKRLDLPMPHLYVNQSPEINAHALGFGSRHEVVLTTAIIQALTPKELQFVIGHELGHIKGNHSVYRIIASTGFNNPFLASLRWVLNFAVLFMSRVNEYSADRAGLIACGEIYSAVTAQLKLMIGREMLQQMNLKEFFRQMDEASKDRWNLLNDLQRTHPLPVYRIRALAHYYRTGEYQAIKTRLGEGGTSILQEPLQGTLHLLDKVVDKYAPQAEKQLHPQTRTAPAPQFAHAQTTAPATPAAKAFCPFCGTANQTQSAFCFKCGTKLK